ncbi:Yip1 family protein [Neobacillus sp. NPDC058068]|uniref:Yip1 family protein n=1 Tax=Neobacillus sp. NPDC058068 TaxID=3346325 RepID=UPI0036DB1226
MEIETELTTKKESPKLLGMFTSPGLQFERIKQNPKIWVSLIIISIIYAVGMTLMALSMDAETLGGSGLPEEQEEIFLVVTKVIFAITGIFAPIITIVISSAIHLIIAKIANSAVSFKQLFSMNTYITIIAAVGLIINMSVRFVIGGDPQINITSLAGLLNQDKVSVLSFIEVFGIWGVILTALGLHKTAQFSKGLAWTIAIAFFLIGIGFGLVGTLFQGAAKL